MLRTFWGESAAVKMKVFHRKFRGLKKGVTCQKLLQSMNWTVFQPGQGEMRSELLPLSWDIDCGERSFYSIAQYNNLVGVLKSGPEDAWSTAGWKRADAFQAQSKFWMGNFLQRIIYIKESASLNFPNKFKGEVELFYGDRSCVRDRSSHPLYFLSDRFGNINGDKQANH